MQPGNRVILNTAILYAKMVVSILVGLISTRLVLKALGVEDYGIYNLVAGVVSMLAFLNTSWWRLLNVFYLFLWENRMFGILKNILL